MSAVVSTAFLENIPLCVLWMSSSTSDRLLTVVFRYCVTSIGSTVVYPYNDETNLPVTELGASIFVKANRNLMRAAKEFDLALQDFNDENEALGVWDGEQFLLQVCRTSSSFVLLIYLGFGICSRLLLDCAAYLCVCRRVEGAGRRVGGKRLKFSGGMVTAHLLPLAHCTSHPYLSVNP